jgi:nucleotide-binding universal stress UspA family protein
MNNTRPILLATDGSPSAGEAQHEAFELAKLTGAPLLVVSVSHATLPTVGYGAYGYSEIVSELAAAEQSRLEEILGATVESAKQSGIDCETIAVHDGVVVDEICRVAAERGAQLLVVGSHGWGAARRFLSGSVSTGLVHAAPCPVLVVRPAGGAQRQAAA